MKRLLSVILMVIIAVAVAGCAAKEAASDVESSNIEASATPSVIDGYELAEYDKYNSYARDNGLGGDKIYVDGIITDVVFHENTFFIIIETDEGDKWNIGAGAFPMYSAAGMEELNGKEVRAFFEYLGFSDVYKTPAGHLFNGGKIECLDGTVYTPTLATKDELCAWIDENGTEIIYSDYSKSQMSDGLFNNQYIIATGMASDISRLVGCSFDFYEKTDDGFANSYIYISESDSPVEGIDTINNGDGVKIYGFINDEADFTVYAIEKAELDFTMESVVDDYKARCEKYDYKTIARDPDVYKGKMAQFTGEVIQVLESGSSVTLRVNVTKGKYSYDDTVYVTYTRNSDTESRILEDDIVTMWGTFAGLQTYDTILGGSVTIPKFDAEYIEIEP